MPKTAVEIEAIARQFGSALDEIFDNVEIRLFGSYYRGSPGKWSDIDLAVVSEDFININYFTAIKILNKFRLKFSDEIEAIPVTPESLRNPPIGSVEFEISRASRILFPF